MPHKSSDTPKRRDRAAVMLSPQQLSRLKAIEQQTGLRRNVLIDRLLDIAAKNVTVLYTSAKSIPA